MKKKYILGIIAAVAALLTGCFIYQRLNVEFHADENGRSVSIISFWMLDVLMSTRRDIYLGQSTLQMNLLQTKNRKNFQIKSRLFMYIAVVEEEVRKQHPSWLHLDIPI